MSDIPHDLLHNTPNNADLPVPFDPMAYNPRLWEGLPSQTNRYDDTNAGPRKKRYVETGVLHATQEHDQHADIHIVPVREGWYEYHHPVEGRPYFYNPELKLVTEMYIRHENVLDRLMEWHRTFVILRDRVLPDAAAFDVYLDCSGGNTCRYYLVDHANRTICWLRQRTTADLGISDVRNKLHLRALLYEEYWTHAEYMPKNENHLGATRAELEGAIASSMLGKTRSHCTLLVLTRPYLDHMTSEGSTSPFTTEECKAYLLGLDKAAESGHMLYLNWSIARIMGLLVHSRNVNVYGQFGARLDRTATVEGRRHPPRGPGYLYQSSLYGGGPVIHLNRLENLWVDRIIYTHHWRALLKDLNDEWTGAAIAAGVMWASNMAFIAGDGVSTVAKVICGLSAILAGACGVYSLHLMREHRALGKYAAHAANYFQLYESHQTGLQELSIRYSTPWAGVMWSFGFTCAAIVFHLFSTILLLAGAYTHVLVTIFLVVGVYVHARGVDLVVSDLQRLPFRLGLAHRHPQTPVARTIVLPNDEPPIYALDEPPANLHSQLQNPPGGLTGA